MSQNRLGSLGSRKFIACSTPDPLRRATESSKATGARDATMCQVQSDCRCRSPAIEQHPCHLPTARKRSSPVVTVRLRRRAISPQPSRAVGSSPQVAEGGPDGRRSSPRYSRTRLRTCCHPPLSSSAEHLRRRRTKPKSARRCAWWMSASEPCRTSTPSPPHQSLRVLPRLLLLRFRVPRALVVREEGAERGLEGGEASDVGQSLGDHVDASRRAL